ncbi:MAG TPA: TPM domain-containing protein [Salinimicrobium sp.]|nr:TPM domain-containing protein [Salinimicrobium sp.]
MKGFLTTAEEEEIVEAIRQAEKQTSGEIRVHIEKKCPSEIFDRAMEVFHQLKMDATKQKNGVLIYVAVEDRNFVIYGDTGINKAVPKDFWESTKDVIVKQFKKSDFKQGLLDGINMAGEQLQKHFPWKRGDENELSDNISKA